ncbi:hypothetical protein Agsp01_11400 [Agromyces sp. NBRC 114283]|nr:hypothetical protein Agsp01_11400 [Agromyces sp. NBRC 114283]
MSERAVEEFVAIGQSLTERLQLELGPGFHVEYWPNSIDLPLVHRRRRRARQTFCGSVVDLASQASPATLSRIRHA